MGYEIYVEFQHFPMDEAGALHALKEFAALYSKSEEKEVWIPDLEDIPDETNIYDALSILGFDYYDFLLSFEGKSSLRRIELILSVLAPFVEEGTVLEASDNEEQRWRWEFKDGKLYEVPGEVVYVHERRTLVEPWAPSIQEEKE